MAPASHDGEVASCRAPHINVAFPTHSTPQSATSRQSPIYMHKETVTAKML